MSKQSNLEEDAGDDVLLAAAKIQAMWKGRQVRKVIAAEVLPIVQFSTSIYYAEEDEEHMLVAMFSPNTDLERFVFSNFSQTVF